MQSLIPNKGIKVSSLNDTFEKLKEPKISKPIMTKYEYNQIVSQRATMLAQGAQPYINIDFDINSNMDLRLIANKELLEGKLPFIIKRPLPGGSCEYWKVKDLEILSF